VGAVIDWRGFNEVGGVMDWRGKKQYPKMFHERKAGGVSETGDFFKQ